MSRLRGQLLDGEGLGDVVVRPHVQAGHLVHHRVPGGEHDDGHLTLLPQAAEHLHARQGGQHDVQQHQVEFPRQGQLQSRAAVKGLLHLIALILELQLHHPGQLFLVLHQQNPFRHVPLSSLAYLPFLCRDLLNSFLNCSRTWPTASRTESDTWLATSPTLFLSRSGPENRYRHPNSRPMTSRGREIQ